MALPDNGQLTPVRVVVTQVITRASTTITALVTLGSDPAAATPIAPVAAPPAPMPAGTTSSGAPLTDGQLGAVLGSVFGFLVIVLFVCYCCFRRRRRPRRRYPYSDSDSSSDHDSEVVVDVRGRDAWRRVQQVQVPRQPFAPVLVPPPARIPPRRYTPYRQTAVPQIRGVRMYP